MARGPGGDYNRLEGNSLPNTDLGQLESRLTGGRGGMHRSGIVMFATNFANSLAEIQTGSLGGTGAAFALDTTLAEFGLQSAKLTHGTVITNQSSIVHDSPALPSGKCGWEIGLRFSNLVWRLWLTLSGSSIDGLQNTYEIKITRSASTPKVVITYLNESNVHTAWISDDVVIGSKWNHLKLIVDGSTPAAPAYEALYINGYKLSMAGKLAYAPTVAAGYPTMTQTLMLEAMVASNQYVNIGSWIFTVDEP